MLASGSLLKSFQSTPYCSLFGDMWDDLSWMAWNPVSPFCLSDAVTLFFFSFLLLPHWIANPT